MKVILLDEVKGKGREGEVVEVARGFAVNYLFPRKMAVEATAGNIKQLEARGGNIRKREEVRRNDAAGAAAAIAGKTVRVEAKSGDGSRLYGSVTTTMIAEAIAAQLGVEVDRRKMDLVGGPIKTLGEHPVNVHVYHDVKADVIVSVVPEGGEAMFPTEPVVPEPVAEPEGVEEALVEETVAEEPDESEADEIDALE
jgi:large subunit ribosomal protein L9